MANTNDIKVNIRKIQSRIIAKFLADMHQAAKEAFPEMQSDTNDTETLHTKQYAGEFIYEILVNAVGYGMVEISDKDLLNNLMCFCDSIRGWYKDYAQQSKNVTVN